MRDLNFWGLNGPQASIGGYNELSCGWLVDVVAFVAVHDDNLMRGASTDASRRPRSIMKPCLSLLLMLPPSSGATFFQS